MERATNPDLSIPAPLGGEGRQGRTRRRRLASATRALAAPIGLPVATVALLIAAWQTISVVEVVDPIVLPPPTDVAEALWRMLGEGFFWSAVKVTVWETVAGFVIGCLLAWLLGTVIAWVNAVRMAVYPLVVAFQNVPRVAFAPLFFSWFGLGLTPKIVMAAAICFFPLLINVVVGLDTVDKDARLLMRSFGASRWQTYRKLELPSSLPLVFAGLKTAMTFALIGAIVAEFVGGSDGLGVLIKTFSYQLQIPESFAVIVAVGTVGLLLYSVIEALDRRVVFWRGS